MDKGSAYWKTQVFDKMIDKEEFQNSCSNSTATNPISLRSPSRSPFVFLNKLVLKNPNNRAPMKESNTGGGYKIIKRV